MWLAVAAAALGWLVVINERLQALLGPLGRWAGALRERRATRAEQLEDARIRDQRDQIDYLAHEVDGLRRREAARDQLVYAHERWDAQLTRALRERDVDIPDPPPLRPNLEEDRRA